MKTDVWKIIDGAIIISIIFLFIAGKALGTNMTGIGDFTTGTLTVTSGNITTHGSKGTEPQAAILMFDTSCPTGWTRQTQFDNAIPYGAAAYSATPGGSATHANTVDSHSHGTGTIDISPDAGHSHAQGSNALTDDPGTHTHNQPGGSVGIGSSTTGACGGNPTGAGGAHTHTVDFNANTGSTTHDHTLSGAISADTDTFSSESTLPAYARLVFCKKN